VHHASNPNGRAGRDALRMLFARFTTARGAAGAIDVLRSKQRAQPRDQPHPHPLPAVVSLTTAARPFDNDNDNEKPVCRATTKTICRRHAQEPIIQL
jgi:hypothetical protein